MHRVIKYQTLDGVLHDSVHAALHHLDVQYTNAASNLASRLVKNTAGRYQLVKDYIDENLDEFVKLRALKLDRIIEEDDSE